MFLQLHPFVILGITQVVPVFLTVELTKTL